MATIIDELLAEMERVKQLADVYEKSLMPHGPIRADGMRVHIEDAERSIITGKTTDMIRARNKLEQYT